MCLARVIPACAGVLHSAGVPVNRTNRCIPARAGATVRHMQATPGTQVHPRTRGKASDAIMPSNQICGSSPRAGGGVRTRVYAPSVSGSSPRARGGMPRCLTEALHLGSSPRGRGTHGQPPGGCAIISSSPRARGGRSSVHLGCPQPRFIPARAGLRLPAGVRLGAGRRARGLPQAGPPLAALAAPSGLREHPAACLLVGRPLGSGAQVPPHAPDALGVHRRPRVVSAAPLRAFRSHLVPSARTGRTFRPLACAARVTVAGEHTESAPGRRPSRLSGPLP